MYKMLKVTAEIFAENCVHTIKVNKTDNKLVLQIKMVDMQKNLNVKNIHVLVDKEIKGKFKTNNLTDEQIKKYKRHGSKLIDGKKFLYSHEGIIISVIMHCRTPDSCKFKRRLGFKLHDVIKCKEQTVLELIKDAFEGENMKTVSSATKLIFIFMSINQQQKLMNQVIMIEILTMKLKDRAIEKELGCVFIRINPDEEKFNIFKFINEIQTH